MSKKTKIFIIVNIIIFLIGLLCGRYFFHKKILESEGKLEKSLKVAEQKMQDIMLRNEEMKKKLADSEYEIKQLSNENSNMQIKLNMVNDICKNMMNDIDNINESSYNGLDKIVKIQENQIKITKYVLEMEKISEE